MTLDAGESNDLHPYDKKLVADRVFNAAMDLVYGRQAQPQPAVETIEVCGDLLRMHCVWRSRSDERIRSEGRRLMTLDGDAPQEIEFLWRDCATSARAEAWLDGCDIVARMTARRPDEVRYAWSNNPESGLICDGDGMLIPPFRLTLPRTMIRGFMRRQVALRQGLVDGFSDTDSVITVFRGIPYDKPSRWHITICLVS